MNEAICIYIPHTSSKKFEYSKLWQNSYRDLKTELELNYRKHLLMKSRISYGRKKSCSYIQIHI